MHRIIAPDNSPTKPDAPVGTQGYAVSEPVGTIIPPEWHNSVQDELLGAIALGGASPDPDDDTQLATLLEPVVKSIAGNNDATPAAVTTAFLRVVTACFASVAGKDDAGIQRVFVAASESSSCEAADSAAVGTINVTIGSVDEIDEGNHFVAGTKAETAGANGVIIHSGTRSVVLAYLKTTVGGYAVKGDHHLFAASIDGSIDGLRNTALSTLRVTLAGTENFVAGTYQAKVGTAAANCAVIASSAGTLNNIEVAPPGKAAEACVVLGVSVGATPTKISGTSNMVAAASDVKVNGDLGAIRAAAIACASSRMDGQESAILGGQGQDVRGDWSACLGGTGNRVDADRSAVVASETCRIFEPTSFIAASEYSDVAAGGRSRAVVLASRYVNTSFSAAATNYNVMGGYNTFPAAPKWRIDSVDGRFRGTNAATTGGLDYAEFFPNADGRGHPAGRLVARAGRATTLGQPGARPIGVVSANPSFVGGSDDLCWAGRYARDEWGAPLWDEDKLEDGRVIRVMRENPDYDRSLAPAHTPRIERPDEWTLVGLVGQLRLAVEEGVDVDDFITCGVDGLGRTSATETRIEVMEIEEFFNPAKGYARALVLVR